MKRKLLLFVFLLLLLSCFTATPTFLIHKFIVLPTSTLSIKGKTNVNTFVCAINRYEGTDTLILKEGGLLQQPVFIKGKVFLKAKLFDCGMKVMTADFCETLQHKKFPNIVIQFYTFQRLPKNLQKQDQFKGTIGIALAGTNKVFEMPCTITPKNTGVIELAGSRQFTFADFNLTPPEKMMGMIKTQQELNVTFKLDLKLDSSF